MKKHPMSRKSPTEKDLESWSRGKRPSKPILREGFGYLNDKEINRYLRDAVVSFHNQIGTTHALPRDAYRCIDNDSDFAIIFSSIHF